ncbi:PREDICTED: uncharacterized protein LOC104820138 [Tarenaya hassleriana]|uniref:uncharacterized protein LOC104820138 n=2 Tax=Tarenaya hassleriana TaxID=28532 RepID=UPI00053C44CF|nr:PREDICTED: uncharacterized protein LOC104820138 [Tarenaya hassleriana]
MAIERWKVDQLVVSAMKAADAVKTKDNLRRCIEALTCLKGLSLSSEDLRESASLQKLERLRDHPNPKIRTEVRELFSSFMRTLYAKPLPTTNSPQVSPSPTCSVSKRVSSDDHSRERCDTSKKNETQLLEMFQAAKAAADAANVKGILLGKSEATRCVDLLSKLMYFTVTRKVLKENRIQERLKNLTKHKNRNICSSASLLLQHWTENTIKNQECHQDSVTKLNRDSLLKCLYASGRRTSPPKAVPKRPLQKKVPPNDPHPPKVSAIPRLAIPKRVKTNEEKRSMTQADILKKAIELSELFEAAKKAADAANTKGILLGRSDSSSCVDFLSRLKTIPVNWEVIEAHGMERRLEHLTKHKDRKICSSATALLQHWRQSSGRQERRVSTTKMSSYSPNFVEVV